MKFWTKETLEEVIRLRLLGKEYKEIGLLYNVSKDVIKTKLTREGIKYNRSFKKDVIKNCKNCNAEFTGFGIEFCSRSCAATFNNKTRITNFPTKCKGCNKTTIYEFCSKQCGTKYRLNENFELIKNGDTSLPTIYYKKFLVFINGNKCVKCGWGEKNEFSGNIPIELEHIDGHSDNNSLDNLTLLCPNCHSLTPTYRSLNKGNGSKSRGIKRR